MRRKPLFVGDEEKAGRPEGKEENPSSWPSGGRSLNRESIIGATCQHDLFQRSTFS